MEVKKDRQERCPGVLLRDDRTTPGNTARIFPPDGSDSRYFSMKSFNIHTILESDTEDYRGPGRGMEAYMSSLGRRQIPRKKALYVFRPAEGPQPEWRE